MYVYRTVSEIFSVKMAWPCNRGQGSFNRSCTTFYWSAIVSIALCCIIFELFGVE